MWNCWIFVEMRMASSSEARAVLTLAPSKAMIKKTCRIFAFRQRMAPPKKNVCFKKRSKIDATDGWAAVWRNSGNWTVGAVYDRPRSRNLGIVVGHRPPLQLTVTGH